MFYDIRVMNSKRMGTVWRAANNQETDTRDVDIHKVCAHLTKWMNYEDNSRRCISLRAASLLVNGAVRVLKEQLDTLYDDSVELTEELFKGRIETNDTVNWSLQYSALTNNSNPRNSKRSSNNSRCSSSYRRLTSENLSPPSDRLDESQNVNSRTFVIQSNENNPNSRSLHKADKEIQTMKSYIANKKSGEEQEKKKEDNEPNLEKKSPVGFVVVYGHESHVPTKIIFSKVNMDVFPQ